MPVGYVSQGGALVKLVLKVVARAEALTFERDARSFTFALRTCVAKNRQGARAVGIRDVEDIAGLRSAAGTVAMVKVYLPATRTASGDVTAREQAGT